MPKQIKINEIRARVSAGRKSNTKQEYSAASVSDFVGEVTAGDWIPVGKSEIEIPEDPEFFYISEYITNGYLPEEIFAPEDMYPTMYRRWLNV